MKSSVEAVWQNERQGRRKMVFWFALIIACAAFTLFVLCFWITQPLFFTLGKQALQTSVSPERLKTHVEKLSKEFVPRSASFPENLDKVAYYIRQEFGAAGGKVSEQEFVANGKTYRNVSAVFGMETKERIVIGAHYDSAGAFPAADDNASGVAGLIELGFLLGKAELPVQIELVAYTLEEPPFFRTEKMGSFVHAKSLKDKSIAVRLMVSLEMIGYFSDEPDSQSFPVSLLSLFYPTRGNYITIVGNLDNGWTIRRAKYSMSAATDLPVYSINAPVWVNGVDFSDHRNYWHFGYNAAMITDTAFYRNPNYHTWQDTAEKLDYNRMAKVVAGVYQMTVDLAK